MPAPENTFKTRLLAGERLIGCWAGFANAYATEITATAGFDWLVIDGEHAPNDIPSMMAQLQVLQGRNSHGVVRLPVGHDWLIKQALDIGAQTLLIPMVDSAEQAAQIGRATRYPPAGVRGAGAALARASMFSQQADYTQTANDQICLLVQVESRAGLADLDAIAQTPGVDGVFIGPADLAADMGYPGRSDAPAVQDAIRDALARIRELGKAPGILATDDASAQRYADWGAQFLAVGIDVVLLAQAARALAARWRDPSQG